MKIFNQFSKIISTAMLPAVLFSLLLAGCGGESKSDQLDGAKVANQPYVSSESSETGQHSVSLASSIDYAVLAGSAITNTGSTKITGDVGLSPGSSVSGFPPGVIIGQRHVANASAVQAKLSLTTAFNNAAERSLNPVAVSGNIGGRTLVPGLYRSTSGLEISSGDLILDANGNGNAVFVFQIASTLTTTTGRKVILTGGARAANIYWQVGTSATLGTNSVFRGTIMADQSITMNTGATLEGRVFARVGGVSLDYNTIVRPTL